MEWARGKNAAEYATLKGAYFTAQVFLFCTFFFLYSLLPGQEVVVGNYSLPADAVPADWYRFISYQFLHLDFSHLFFNMLLLLLFAPDLERQLGYFRQALLYLLSGATGGVAYCFSTSGSYLIGASGAIAGVLAATLLLRPHARIVLGPLTMPAWPFIFIWAVEQLSASEKQLFLGADGIAYQTHLGGFVAGLLLAMLWGKNSNKVND